MKRSLVVILISVCLVAVLIVFIVNLYRYSSICTLESVSLPNADIITTNRSSFQNREKPIYSETNEHYNISEPSKKFNGKNNKLIVLMYHHIDDMNYIDKYYYVKPSSFCSQMKYLYENGYMTLTFENIKSNEKYQKPVVITFDDGYDDNYLNAYPILKNFGLKATIFLIAQFIDKPAYLKCNYIKEMRDVISFQSHTNCHPNLKTIDKDLIAKECIESKRIIENLTFQNVLAIAYPYGMYNQDVIDTVKKYYTYGITGDNGYYMHNNDRYTIKRVAITYVDTLEDFINKVQ